ncbi:MAG: hypothetical protein P9L95_02580 [Candidatus Tenebribacter mawsonii]|nr:hypothetical protein [Candidatus Tenebribacter mawsonii]
MWKWILKQSVKALAEPIVDAILDALEVLSKRTGNTIDDAFVEKFKEFKETIVGWIISNSRKIAKSV